MKNKIFAFIVLLLIGIYAWWAIPTVNAITQTPNVRGSGQTDGSTYRISGTKPGWQITQMNTATNASDLTTTSTSYVDITGMSITLTTGANRVLVGFSGIGYNDTTASLLDFTVDIDGSAADGIISFAQSVANYRSNVSFTYLSSVLTAASHTIKIQWKVSANTGNLRGAIYTTKMWVTEMK